MTNQKAVYSPIFHAKQLGLCVHGQTVTQLCKLLKSQKSPPMANKVLLMIGTNDLLKRVPKVDTEGNFEKLLESMSGTCEKVIVCTIPPVPKVWEKEGLDSWKEVNGMIRDCCSKFAESNVSLLDLDSIFVKDAKPLEMYFEISKFDNIHWNEKGISAFQAAMESFLISETKSDEGPEVEEMVF